VPIPSRPVPRVGAPARIVHFGGGVERCVIVGVYEEGRRLQVRDEAGEVLEYVLSPATARFMPEADSRGPRLELLGEQGDGREAPAGARARGSADGPR
jgi:hypothetical protein